MKKIFTLVLMTLFMSISAIATTYSVVGSNAIMNGTTSWDIANVDNEMTLGADGNYTLVIKSKVIPTGSYEYKVAADHVWTEAYPSKNATLAIPSDAKYDVTFTFNPTTKDVAATAVKVGEAGEITHTYTLAGVAALATYAWDVTKTENDLVKGDDGIYSLKKSSLTLAAGDYGFKIARDHDWGVSYPSSDKIITIADAGVYDIIFSFNPATTDVTYTVNSAATSIGSIAYTESSIVPSYSLSGQKMNQATKGLHITKNGKYLVR